MRVTVYESEDRNSDDDIIRISWLLFVVLLVGQMLVMNILETM
jgi:hypothetical protein